MKAKKIVSLFAATAMVVGTLAGCGGAASPAPAADGTTPAADSSKPAAETPAADSGSDTATADAAGAGDLMEIEIYDAAACKS